MTKNPKNEYPTTCQAEIDPAWEKHEYGMTRDEGRRPSVSGCCGYTSRDEYVMTNSALVIAIDNAYEK